MPARHIDIWVALAVMISGLVGMSSLMYSDLTRQANAQNVACVAAMADEIRHARER